MDLQYWDEIVPNPGEGAGERNSNCGFKKAVGLSSVRPHFQSSHARILDPGATKDPGGGSSSLCGQPAVARKRTQFGHQERVLRARPNYFARGTRGARLPTAMRYALRKLAASPGFMIVALVTLALGIGVNTTAFTVLNRLMLQALPYHDPASLVQLWSTSPRWGNIPNAPADYFDEREQSTVFTDIAAFSTASVSYAEVGKPPIQIGALYMTANFFTVLGVQPQLGRLLPALPGKVPTIVVCSAFLLVLVALRAE
jgi:hypothetical protein